MNGIAYLNKGAGRVLTADETRERSRAAFNLWRQADYIAPECHAAIYLRARPGRWLAAKRFRRCHPMDAACPAPVRAEPAGAVPGCHRHERSLPGGASVVFSTESVPKFGAPLKLRADCWKCDQAGDDRPSHRRRCSGHRRGTRETTAPRPARCCGCRAGAGSRLETSENRLCCQRNSAA